jgi:hypothetical protein
MLTVERNVSIVVGTPALTASLACAAALFEKVAWVVGDPQACARAWQLRTP